MAPMDINLYKKLHEEGLIGEETLERAIEKDKNPLFSLHWELKTLLYLGVMLLSTGLGILIYENIDTIGHQVILLFIAVISGSCFFYCAKNVKPFSRGKVQSPNSFFDYILLLGCLSMVSFLGYLQFQYHVFGIYYGMATLMPTIALYYIAYQFDHIGVLGMAITSMALWMGLTITPASFYNGNNFNNENTVYTYLFLGLLLLLAGHLSAIYHYKKHFKFNYQHFGLNIAFISLLAGYFRNTEVDYSILWLAGVFALAALLYFDALKEKSFYFLLLILIYTYIATTIIVFLWLGTSSGILGAFMYVIITASGFIVILSKLNKKLKE